MCKHGHHESKVCKIPYDIFMLMCVLCVTDTKPSCRCTTGMTMMHFLSLTHPVLSLALHITLRSDDLR